MRRSPVPLFLFSLFLAACAPTQEKVIFPQGSLKVDVADTSPEREKGLMFRQSLPEDQGILFDFKEPGKYSFWMKNTPIPLSIAFLNEKGTVLELDDMEPNDSTHFHTSPSNTRYAVEANKGWFTKNKVAVGDTAQLPVSNT